MTDLEWIEKCLKQQEEALKGRDLTSYQERQVREHKKHLQQIKTELEAWYIIKDALEVTENGLGEEEIEMKVFFTNAKVEVCDTRKEFKKLKKALEVKDNDFKK